LEAAEGVAVSALTPEGIVRVRGEEWSAVSVNGPVPADTKVQVLRAGGVRLEVWGENGEIGPRERFEEWYL
jgi:membrane-bound ClpP family serine protease